MTIDLWANKILVTKVLNQVVVYISPKAAGTIAPKAIQIYNKNEKVIGIPNISIVTV